MRDFTENMYTAAVAADVAVAAADAKTAGDALAKKLDSDKLSGAVDDALRQAKESGEFNGAPGKPGVTPHIGENGNWFVGDADTGVKAQGDDYVLTDADKSEIAQIAVDLLPKYNGEVEDV